MPPFLSEAVESAIVEGGQLRPEALPVSELGELALLDGPSEGLLL
jgi:hypothetical protein